MDSRLHQPPAPVETPANQQPVGPNSYQTYAGNWGFHHDQTEFDNIFKPFPSLPDVTQTTWNKFLKEAEFTALCQLMRLDYVGSLESNDSRSVSALTKRIRELKMVETDTVTEPDRHFTNPDALFCCLQRACSFSS